LIVTYIDFQDIAHNTICKGHSL